MPTRREQIRAKQAEQYARAADKGIFVSEPFREREQDPAKFTDQATTYVNESIPRSGRTARLSWVAPPTGAFDGTNTEFTLSEAVVDNDILVWHITQADGSLTRLIRTNSSAPAAGAFFFDGLSLIRVGTAPAAADMLLVNYATPR